MKIIMVRKRFLDISAGNSLYPSPRQSHPTISLSIRSFPLFYCFSSPTKQRPIEYAALRSLAVLIFLLASQSSAGWIDPDTPINKQTTQSFVDKSTYHLVMSDEFNVPNRSFKDGHDSIWTALDKSDDDSSSAGGGSLHFYNSSTVTTRNGFLEIKTILQKTEWNRFDHVNKGWSHEVTNFSSGMVQSWNKFCFTGGIVEVDLIFPGEPFIGGLWPAVWMLGNLGRATYEASTNNIWPWSYDTCNRDLQQAQAISACNKENHFGMNPYQGRGATEIDIVEVMTGDSNGPLPSTNPPIALPYADLTLQVAPGVVHNRPQSGSLPNRKKTFSKNGHTAFEAQTWYDGLLREGNTSINPFFYGTYLAETKPNEPVTRSKVQAFQADAVGVAHQLTPSHFMNVHTFRVEWQPGPGGRLDWFVKGYRINDTLTITGNGDGEDWTHVYSLEDSSLKDLMGSQIPIEPSYLIMNTAISSTWGFPYDAPDWCPRCYDCNDPKCACRFYPGFCEMLRHGNVTFMIDSVRVYQSRDPNAHVGFDHTLGCDPPSYPTKEWINGHTYRYMRNPPFSFQDLKPLRDVQKGGGDCLTDRDCGGDLHNNVNLSSFDEDYRASGRRTRQQSLFANATQGRGVCNNFFRSSPFSIKGKGRSCQCFAGYTGPHCLSLDHIDTSPSAHAIRMRSSPFSRISNFAMPLFMMMTVSGMIAVLLIILIARVYEEKKAKKGSSGYNSSKHVAAKSRNSTNATVLTGSSI